MPGISSPYIIYKCDTCARETERQQDPRRPDPLRCTITLNCRGKMARSGERAAKKFLFPSTSTSLIDWRARGTKIDPTNAVIDPTQISLYTVRSGQGMTIATKSTTATAGFIVLYELTPELVKYKKYAYLINTIVQQVRGADDSADRNVLRFTATEKVRVYVNGVELDESDYDRTVDNEITFTPMLTTTNNLIEVVVYDDISSTITDENTVRLPLIRLVNTDSRRTNFTWGNASIVKIAEENYTLLFNIDVSELIQGRSYGMVGIELVEDGATVLADPTSVKFLLGKYPFAAQDKDRFAYAEVNVLIDDVVFSYKTSNTSNALELTVADSAITQVASPILRTIIDSVDTGEATTTLSQGTAVLKRKYTLGPV